MRNSTGMRIVLCWFSSFLDVVLLSVDK
ncbi:hypothetical protein AHF37_08419 [Paragonimus kellicotti]|nr:hypothetical protein AHF37_08419 [Paragonimus kellicotti]